MRKILFVICLVSSLKMIGQSYIWDFAMSTGTCPNNSRTYPYDLNLINDRVIDPIGVEVDDSGNAYVIGRFPSFAWSKEYRINDMWKVKIPDFVNNNAYYIYKINAIGEIQWAHCISHESISLENSSDELIFTVNPFSGKIYIVFTANDHFVMDQNVIFTHIDNSKHVQSKMMLCLNNNGSYHKTIFSPGVLSKPVFSSESKGIYKSSKISDFYPWDDSISFFLLDAIKDTAISYVYAYSERILAYDKQKKVYRTDLLTEYSPDLVKTNNKIYVHSHLGSVVSSNDVVNVGIDMNGSTYIYYYNKDPNTINNERLYYLLKLDANRNRKWVHAIDKKAGFQMDQEGNPWLYVKRGDIYKVDLNINYQNYPLIENNPSDAYIIKLDSANGDVTSTKIIPTNMIQQSNMPGLFKIDQNNNFWIAGFMYNEMEFGNTRLYMNCPNNYLPLQHFVARAKEGWGQTRKNLNISNNLSDGLIGIYPNPASTILHINSNNIDITSVEVFNILGAKVISTNVLAYNAINIEELSAGIYTLKIEMNHQLYTSKFVKQ